MQTTLEEEKKSPNDILAFFFSQENGGFNHAGLFK